MLLRLSILMNETQLQQLFKRYCQTQDLQDQDDCVKDLSVMVYGYSKKHFPMDTDTSSDFFMEVYPKLEHLLSSYNPSRGVSLNSYLSFRLTLLFRTFLVRKQSEKNYIRLCRLQESFTPPKQPTFMVLGSDENLLHKQLSQRLYMLDNPGRLFLKLHYGLALSLQDFRFLRGHSMFKGFTERYRLIRTDLQAREEKNKEDYRCYMQKLTRYNILSQTHPKKKAFYRKRYYNLLNDPPPLPSVAKLHEISFLSGLSISTVQRKLSTAKREIHVSLTQTKLMRKL